MQLFKPFAAALAVAAVFTLAGCTVLTEEDFQRAVANRTTYDASHSYAWNVMKLRGHTWRGSEKIGVADTYLPDEFYEDLKKSVGASSTVPEPGLVSTELLGTWMRNGRQLPAPVPKAIKEQYKPFFLGYLPRAAAAAPADAIAQYRQILMDAYTKAARDLRFGNIEADQTGIRASRASTRGSIDIRIVGGIATHSIFKKFIGEVWKTRVPVWIDSRQGEAWAIGTFASEGVLTWGRFEVVDGIGSEEYEAKSIELKRALLDRVAANLPDNFFLYVPTYQSGTPGEPGVRLLPHCIASNKARYYFVMPQSARKDPEKKD